MSKNMDQSGNDNVQQYAERDNINGNNNMVDNSTHHHYHAPATNDNVGHQVPQASEPKQEIKTPKKINYSISSCQDKNYRYVQEWIRRSFIFMGIAPLIGVSVYTFSHVRSIREFLTSPTISMQTVLPAWFTWLLFLGVVFVGLYLFSGSFRVRFMPRRGLLIAGKRVYDLNNIAEIEGYSDGRLRLSPKHDDKDINLPLSPKAAKYISRCIGQIWQAHS